MMLTRRSMIGLLAATPFLARPAFAASPEVFAEGGLAIRGADPVAFFTAGAPTAGDAAHSLMWKGATWQFASAENMTLFEANPEAYAPQFGGYCAFAMSKGAIATSVPEAWTIVDDKLYLNYSVNVRTIWSQDIPGNIEKANGHWPDILTA
ncbi:YHS domain-containing (seleno)protein [Yoonia sp. R2331]|uniref:YHS domain-containing (seleno)protein n=1 Tax=Yoonia sp. R2331 TaxID=3237238 RepID=UPI0034E4B3C1